MQIDKRALTRAPVASAVMAGVILILEQILYAEHLLPGHILVRAVAYITLIRALRVLDREDFQLLSQLLGKTPAKYAAKILGGQSENI